jgi:predicted acetyltransferase
MDTTLRYDRPGADGDGEALAAMMRQAFAASADRTTGLRTALTDTAFRVMRGPTGLAAALARLEFAQWFGGRPVPCTGIAAVTSDPAARGRGIATALMSALLHELHAEGQPISTLYPATLPLYRGAGYGYGGDSIRFQAPPQVLRVRGDARHLNIRRHPVPDRAVLAALRRSEAVAGNGLIDRNDILWGEVLSPPDGEADVFTFDGEDGPEGYAILRRGEGEVEFLDLCAPTAAAARAALHLASGYWSQVERVYWTGGPDDALVMLAAERGATPARWRRWMLRIIDLPAAMAARGWPDGIEAELVLEVDDPVLPANGGSWRLTVAGGRAEAQRARPGDSALHLDGNGVPRLDGNGALRLGAGALASLYAGYLSAERLAALGEAEGSASALATATRLFAGPRPWTADFF